VTFLAAGLAALWGLVLALPHWRGDISLLDRLEGPLTDLRFLLQGERRPPDLITIIAIDNEAVHQAGGYPLPRATLARLLERIAASHPRAIALDLLLVDAGPNEGDQALTDALRHSPAVLAAAGTFRSALQSVESGGTDRLEGVPLVEHLLVPLRRFSEVAAVGTVNMATDTAGTPRYLPLILRSGDQLAVSLPLRTASIALGQDPVLDRDGVGLGEREVATDQGHRLPLRFYGPRGTVRTISAARVLAGEIAEHALSNRVVLVGATVTGAGDVFPTPFDQVLPGVEVLATATAHLLTGDGLLRDWRVRAVDAAVAVSLPVLLILLLAWHRNAAGFLLLGVVLVLWMGVAAGTFMYGIWLSATLPLVAALPPAMVFGAARLWLDRSRADSLAVESGILRRFQPPSLAERLARDPEFLNKPVRQQAAVVFVDLSGFTGLSERLGPDETRSLLKEFHSLVDEEAVRSHGLVASFMGDGAMILFGLPDPADEDACHAVEVCVSLCSRTTSWLASLPPSISSCLGFKIGAHFGPIVASRLGGGSHEHITAIGDTVNVASRLMEVAATHGAEVALTEELYRAAGKACKVFDAGTLDGSLNEPIRGRAGTLAVRLWKCSKAESASGR